MWRAPDATAIVAAARATAMTITDLAGRRAQTTSSAPTTRKPTATVATTAEAPVAGSDGHPITATPLVVFGLPGTTIDARRTRGEPETADRRPRQLIRRNVSSRWSPDGAGQSIDLGRSVHRGPMRRPRSIVRRRSAVRNSPVTVTVGLSANRRVGYGRSAGGGTAPSTGSAPRRGPTAPSPLPV